MCKVGNDALSTKWSRSSFEHMVIISLGILNGTSSYCIPALLSFLVITVARAGCLCFTSCCAFM